jgi:hypothetical protein
VSLGPDDPRRVGGWYWDEYWQRDYVVLAIVDFDDWRGRSITVRYDEPCVWHDPPCLLSRTVTHGTAWEPGRDRVLSEARHDQQPGGA